MSRAPDRPPPGRFLKARLKGCERGCRCSGGARQFGWVAVLDSSWRHWGAQRRRWTGLADIPRSDAPEVQPSKEPTFPTLKQRWGEGLPPWGTTWASSGTLCPPSQACRPSPRTCERALPAWARKSGRGAACCCPLSCPAPTGTQADHLTAPATHTPPGTQGEREARLPQLAGPAWGSQAHTGCLQGPATTQCSPPPLQLHRPLSA